MTGLSYRNGVAVAEIVVYVPALAVAIFLTARHGLSQSAGWRFLVIFTLARFLGACFQLATIGDPTNTSLYIAAFVLLNVAISPLQLTALGLLSRLVTSINTTWRTVVTVKQIQLVGLVNLVGLILTIVGGVNSGSAYAKTGVYAPQTLTKAGLALFIVSFVALAAGTMITSFSVKHAEPGERRISLALALSLPLMLVRLIYTAVFTFGNVARFSTLSGSTTILLCMALLEEFAIIIIYEGVGVTLKKIRTPSSAGSESFLTRLNPFNKRPTPSGQHRQPGYMAEAK